jgi:hypothetical protein
MVYAIFVECLSALACCVFVYQQSLAIFGISPDLDSDDGDLAASGIAAVEKMSVFALLLIEDTLSLKKRDQALVRTALEGSEIQLKALRTLGTKIYEVLSQRRLEQGRST